MKMFLSLVLVLFAAQVDAANFKKVTKIWNAGNMAGSINSSGFDAWICDGLSVQAVFSGASPTGTFKIQVSDDPVDAAADVTNWTDYSSSSQAISANGNFGWSFAPFGYRFLRLAYTRTSGTGNVTAYAHCKGFK